MLSDRSASHRHLRHTAYTGIPDFEVKRTPHRAVIKGMHTYCTAVRISLRSGRQKLKLAERTSSFQTKVLAAHKLLKLCNELFRHSTYKCQQQ